MVIEYRRSTGLPDGIAAVLVADADAGIVVMNALMNVTPDSRAVTMLTDKIDAPVAQS